MNTKNTKLILILIVTFLITNGTFFAFCENDIVLDYINRIGNWSKAILWHSTFIFGTYTFANMAYNIDYVGPKILHSLFIIKYADMLNGWLGFSSKGELETYLATAKQGYSPLYKDFLLGVNANVGLPIYNNIWSPFISFCSFKNSNANIVRTERVTEYVDRPVDRVNHVPVINTQQFSDLQAVVSDCHQVATDLKFNLTLELSNIRRDWNSFLSRSNVTNHVGEDLSFLTQYLNENYVRSNSYSFSRIDFCNINRVALYKITDLTILNDAVTKFNLYTSQISERQAIRGLEGAPSLIAYYSDVLSPEGCLIICNISTIFTNDREFLGIQVPHDQLSTSAGLRLLEFLKNSSNPQTNFLRYNTDANNLIIKGFLAVSNLDPEGLFEETSIHINALNSHVAQASIAFTGLASLATGLVDSSQGILHAIDLINNFNVSIQNTEMGGAIANVFMHYGQPLPEILQHYASNSITLPNPQDFASAEFLNAPQPMHSSISSSDAGIPTPYFKYIGTIVIVVGAIGGGIYLWKSGYLDYNSAVETAKSFQETLREKYINFK
jgi:hypothetical protein